MKISIAVTVFNIDGRPVTVETIDMQIDDRVPKNTIVGGLTPLVGRAIEIALHDYAEFGNEERGE